MGHADIYAGRSVDRSQLNNFFADNKDSLVTFWLIIDELGSGVFGINSQSATLHIYFDPESASIAFTIAITVFFFNFAYFLGQ